LAGFEQPDHGSIRVNGEEVTGIPPARRGFGMVFQHYALFPHMTVAQNIAFGLEAQGWTAADRGGRITEMLRLVDLQGFEERRVSAISGGQQQRVALARALAPRPRLLLLDEPLSNLDPALRERTRRELREAVRDVGITTVLVTHEQEEAFHVGDRVAVLHGGHLHQLGSPQDLYHAPASRFVATFIGRATAFEGTLAALDGEGAAVRLDVGERSVLWRGEPAHPLEIGERVELVVRPEALVPSADVPEALPVEALEHLFTGALAYHILRLEDGTEVEVLARPGDGGPPPRIVPTQDGPTPRIFRKAP
jgi:ABC-type Fe3+/spermidine/putrescine transport system ATPase subunit